MTVELALRRIEQVDQEIDPVYKWISRYARHQPGCQALMERFGIGPITSTTIVAYLGDARRSSSSRRAVRLPGQDVTIAESDDKRRLGKLPRQEPPLLRWALNLVESAQFASQRKSPDHAYYLQAKERIGHKRARLSDARRIIRWAHHTLRNLEDAAVAAPVEKKNKAA